MAGAAKAAGAALCAAWMMCAAASGEASQGVGAPAFAQPGAARQASDMAMLGLPPAALADLRPDAGESMGWARLAARYPGGAGAEWIAYSMRRPEAGGPGSQAGFDSGKPSYAGGRCRVAMPSRAAADAGLASMLGLSAAQAASGGFAALEAAHELGHCAALSRSGPAGGDAPLVAGGAFEPHWAALPVAGAASLAWGEAYADAFMAIESLALDGPAAEAPLAAVAKARSRDAAGDPARFAGSWAIRAALARSASWSSMDAEARLKSASDLAGQAARAFLAPSGPAAAAGWSISALSAASVAREALLDASARLQEEAASGLPARGEPCAGLDPQAPGCKALARLVEASEAALAARGRAAGLDWAKPSRSKLGKAIDSAASDPALAAAAEDFAGSAQRGMRAFMEEPAALASLAGLASRSWAAVAERPSKPRGSKL